MSNDNQIIIFDTTLRDGEQSPGASMNLEEKIRVAHALEEMGVDVIEAGFPIASKGDFESVNQISKVIKNAVICGLCRASTKDIDRCAEAIKPAARGRIHTFISTSPLHMKHKLKMEPDAVHDKVRESIEYARKFTDDVEWSAEDASRTEIDFLCRCVETAIDAGAKTINLPDTVGYAIPDEHASMILNVLNRVPNVDKAIISVHCHNDLGLAVANSLAAVKAGARQVECTINGLGERAGNASLEEIVMALRTRRDILPFSNNIITEHITRASRLVSGITGFLVQPNKAIVGANAFAHEAGIHQDGVLKHAATYEIMTPESVGLKKSNMVLGKHSGRHAFKDKLKSLGFELEESDIEVAFEKFKDLADKKKDVFDEDIVAIVERRVLPTNDYIHLVSMFISSGTSIPRPEAEMELEIDGKVIKNKAGGDGSVDAIFNAIKGIVKTRARLKTYQVQAITGGTDAQANITVRLEEDGHTVNGHGVDTDTLVASARAYINALNKLEERRRNFDD